MKFNDLPGLDGHYLGTFPNAMDNDYQVWLYTDKHKQERLALCAAMCIKNNMSPSTYSIPESRENASRRQGKEGIYTRAMRAYTEWKLLTSNPIDINEVF